MIGEGEKMHQRLNKWDLIAWFEIVDNKLDLYTGVFKSCGRIDQIDILLLPFDFVKKTSDSNYVGSVVSDGIDNFEIINIDDFNNDNL